MLFIPPFHASLRQRYCNPTHGVGTEPPWLHHRAEIVRLEYGDGESVRYTPHRTVRLHTEFSVWSAGWSACLLCLSSPYVMPAMCCRVCDCRNDIRCFVKLDFTPHVGTCIRIASGPRTQYSWQGCWSKHM